MDTIIKESEITPEQRYLLRFGHKPINIPSETDDLFEFRNIGKDLLNTYQNICTKVEKNIENLLKAAMFLLQDYNVKHYTIIKKNIDEPHENDRIRYSIEVHIRHNKSSKNGHRRNHALSTVFREYAEGFAPEATRRHHLFIPFDVLHCKTNTSKFYSKYVLDSMEHIARAIGVENA